MHSSIHSDLQLQDTPVYKLIYMNVTDMAFLVVWRLEAYLSLLRVRDLWLLDLCRDLFVDGDLLRDVADDLEDEEEDDEEEGDLSRLLDCRPGSIRLGDLERRLWP